MRTRGRSNGARRQSACTRRLGRSHSNHTPRTFIRRRIRSGIGGLSHAAGKSGRRARKYWRPISIRICRPRPCPRTARAAQRDSQWAAPPNGAACITTDTGSQWQRIGGVWYRPFSVLGSAQIATNTGSVTAETAMGVSVTVTIPAGRKSASRRTSAASIPTAVGTAGFVRIKEGAARLQECQYGPASSLGATVITIVVTLAPTGSYVHAVLTTVSGTALVTAGTTFPSTLDVIDMGAA